MAKRSLSEQLDEALEATMAAPDSPLPRVDASLAALLRIAADLRDLPREDFKARLKNDLQTSGSTPGKVKPVPEGYHTATPCLVIRDAARAIEFYKQAFGAMELTRHADPNGTILHAEIQVGDSRIAIADEVEEWGNYSPQSLGGSPVIMSLYVDDVDALADRAIAGGAKMIFPIADQFYGDRCGRLADPFGHIWIVSTHTEDVSPEEMQRRMQASTQQPPAAEAGAEQAKPSYTVEPYFPVRGAARLIDFLQQAFGAEETSRDLRPDGTIAHAEVRIGDSLISTGDSAEIEPMPTAIHLYVPDTDAVYLRALRAGSTSMEEPADQDYGERSAGVRDPFGNHWYIATYMGAHARAGATHIPQGLHVATPYLHPHGAPDLIDFLKRAFEAEEVFRAQGPDGTVHHAKIRIGESIVEMGEAHGPYQPMPSVFHLYVNETDAAYRRALAAGALSLSEPANQPWGFRNAGVQDPGGNQWWINTPIQKVTALESAAPSAPIAVAASPPEFRSVTPFLQVRDVSTAIDFLKEAFGAEVITFDRGGDPPHDHADLRIGDSMVMMGETIPGFEPTSAAFYLQVDDADVVYRRALKAGLTSMEAPQDKPWGDRMAHVKDALGNSWFIAAQKKDGQH
ncbi:MAG: VOC family protein [Deltaproteobacteria bacterium]|nr:VOC family protein [Deltaproteobacteria bacterium]MBI3386238.1 VOC family protein [Deltaproteobacteria bacterium]